VRAGRPACAKLKLRFGEGRPRSDVMAAFSWAAFSWIEKLHIVITRRAGARPGDPIFRCGVQQKWVTRIALLRATG